MDNTDLSLLSLKQNLRKEVRQKISAISDHIPEYSAAICNHILQSDAYKNASDLLVYMALPDEADLQPLIDSAVHEKNIFIPKVNQTDNTISFFKYSCNQMLSTGAFGIKEPQTDDSLYNFNPQNKTLIIVPGRAFSTDGSRLGRGKAFYDSFLKQARDVLNQNVVFCGVGFSVQFFDNIPQEAHDIKMDCLVNENGLIIPRSSCLPRS